MLKSLMYLVSQTRCSHFSGGSYGGIRSPSTGQEPPLGVCNIVIPLFEYCFIYCPQSIHLYHCYNRWPYVVSNRDILAKTKLKTISTEVKIRRWKWVGHILRMEKNSNCETALTWTPEGKRKVGRPKTTWRSTIENERRILGWNSWNEARRVAADRTRWRRFTSALWATGPEEDR